MEKKTRPAINKKIVLHLVLIMFFLFYLASADYIFDRMITVNGEARLQQFSHGNETCDIKYNIEQLDKTRLAWKDAILLSGWAFVESQNMTEKKIYIVLRSNSSDYILDTMPFKRDDITDYFYNGTHDLTNAGWRINIPESLIGNNEFQVGYLIRNDSTDSFVMSGHYINKTSFYWK